MLIIINANKAKNKMSAVIKPNLIPLIISATPNTNMVTKILAVPTSALLITPLSNPYFLYAKRIPKAAEKRENNINFIHAGIVTNAKIKIITIVATNAPIYFMS